MYRTDDLAKCGKKKERLDIAGQRFGKLTAIEYAFTNAHGKSMWKCGCECGRERTVAGSHLVNGHTTSCGCAQAEAARKRATKHGEKKTRLYRIWQGMKSRCTIETSPCFKHYGDRGIKICDEWLNSFEAFRDWALVNGYQDRLTLDRIDVDGDYHPENCRWVTIKEQSRNKRGTIWVTTGEEAHSLAEWAEITGINYFTLYSRYKAGKSPAEILRREKAVLE